MFLEPVSSDLVVTRLFEAVEEQFSSIFSGTSDHKQNAAQSFARSTDSNTTVAASVFPSVPVSFQDTAALNLDITSSTSTDAPAAVSHDILESYDNIMGMRYDDKCALSTQEIPAVQPPLRLCYDDNMAVSALPSTGSQSMNDSSSNRAIDQRAEYHPPPFASQTDSVLIIQGCQNTRLTSQVNPDLYQLDMTGQQSRYQFAFDASQSALSGFPAYAEDFANLLLSPSTVLPRHPDLASAE